jgi:hypothetical protein
MRQNSGPPKTRLCFTVRWVIKTGNLWLESYSGSNQIRKATQLIGSVVNETYIHIVGLNVCYNS